MDNRCIVTRRAGRQVQYVSSPYLLWSPTGCIISEPEPSSVLGYGASGVQTSQTGLKRKVNNFGPKRSIQHNAEYCSVTDYWKPGRFYLCLHGWMKALMVLSVVYYLHTLTDTSMRLPIALDSTWADISSSVIVCRIPNHWNAIMGCGWNKGSITFSSHMFAVKIWIWKYTLFSYVLELIDCYIVLQ